MKGKSATFAFLAVFAAVFACADAFAAKGDGEAGKQSFITVCASCHGEGGKGDGIASAALTPKPRDLSDAEYLSTLTDEYLFEVINKGGMAVGKSAMMPPWGGVLGDEGAWNVIAYIREDICGCEPATE
ncbi:MAG: cytochrome c [Candidatus Dadabacteria bacterium]|nr:cytochrome c [Candidatus Dadabacteria bacterium]